MQLALALEANSQSKPWLLNVKAVAVGLPAARVSNAVRNDHLAISAVRSVTAIDTVAAATNDWRVAMMVTIRSVGFCFARKHSAKCQSCHCDDAKQNAFHNLGPLENNQPEGDL